MKKIDIGQAIGIFANLGVLGGVLFLGIELRQNTQAVQLTSAESYLSGGSALDLRIAQDPALASLLMRDQNSEPLTDVDERRLERWNHASLRQWETAQYLYSIGALDESLWLAYRHEIGRIMRRATSLTGYWEANRESFTQAFNSEVEMLLSEDAPQ
jgi:phytoene dehydrogenase-like protein